MFPCSVWRLRLLLLVGVQPVFAEERVANAETETTVADMFRNRTVVSELRNTEPGSNKRGSDGTYNSQIESVSVVSEDGDSVRYRLKLKDGFTIPKDGEISFYVLGHTVSGTASSNILMNGVVVGRIGSFDGSGVSKTLVSDLRSESSLGGFKKKLNEASAVDVVGAAGVSITFNDNFARLNKDRQIEFVLSGISTGYIERGFPELYVKGVDNAELFDTGGSSKKYAGQLIIPSIKNEALKGPYSVLRYPLVDSTTKLIDDPKYRFTKLMATSVSDGSVPSYLTDVAYMHDGWLFSVHEGSIPGEVDRIIERNKVGSDGVFLKKGDVLKFEMGNGSKNIIKFKSNLKVGDVVNNVYAYEYSSSNVDSPRFTDSDLYDKSKKLAVNRSSIPLKVVAVSDDYVSFALQSNISLVNNGFIKLDFSQLDRQLPVSLKDNWLSIYGQDELKQFLMGTRNTSVFSSTDGFDSRMIIERDGGVLATRKASLALSKNPNVAFGDATTGTVKVRYVDSSGAVISGTSTETIADGKPWYEMFTIRPKTIKGYTYVSADKPLSAIVGSGEQIVTLTYKQDITYIPDPQYDAGTKVPDPDDPSKIHVGTKPKVVEEDIPFKEEVRENPKLPKGTENVIQEGEKGKKTTTTTYTVDPKTGDVTPSEKVTTKDSKNRIIERGTGEDKDGDLIVNYIPDPENEPGKQTIVDEGKKPKLDVTGKVKDPGKPKVIKVGTKPKVVEEEIPFKEEVRENPKLPKGTENVIQEGEKGKKTTTTTYTVDPKTGDVTPSEKVTTKDPKNRIIERGTGEDKDGDLVVNYIPDPENEPGKQTIVDEGKKPKLDVTGKVKDPGKPKVIKVGTKPKVVEEEIPFKEEVRENPKLPKGTENVIQEGEKGKKTTTTTYTLDEKTGKVTSSEKVTTKDPKNRIIERGTGEDKDGDLVVNYIPDPENEPGKQTIVDEGKKPKLDVTGKVKDPGKPKVIKVGTKPKVVEEDIPFKEEVRENPKLPKGSEFVIQEGEKGKKKTTTTYTLDPKTGKVTSEDKVETKDPKNRIIERGTGEDVDGEIVVTYIPDPENDPGKQTVVDEGSKPKLDVTGKVKDPGKPKVIKVGTKPKVVEEEIPFKEEVRENSKLPKGTENVIQEGEKGKKTTTTTYTMDPKTGEVKPTEKVTTKDPKNRIVERGTGENKDGDLIVKYIPDPEEEPGKQTVVDEGKKPKFDVTGKEIDPGSPKVIKVGTKPKVVEEEVPFKEEVRENPELPEGERKVIQEGQVGKKTTTTTYTLDEKTGKVKESTTEKVDEPKVQIVEVGTKKSEVPKEEPKVETPKTTEVPKKEEPKVEVPRTEQPKTTEEPKAKETPKQLPKTSEQSKQRNTAIIALLSVVGLGGLATYFGLRKRDEK